MNVGVLVRVAPEEREKWKTIAAREGLSVNQLVRQAVEASLASREKP